MKSAWRGRAAVVAGPGRSSNRMSAGHFRFVEWPAERRCHIGIKIEAYVATLWRFRELGRCLARAAVAHGRWIGRSCTKQRKTAKEQPEFCCFADQTGSGNWGLARRRRPGSLKICCRQQQKQRKMFGCGAPMVT